MRRLTLAQGSQTKARSLVTSFFHQPRIKAYVRKTIVTLILIALPITAAGAGLHEPPIAFSATAYPSTILFPGDLLSLVRAQVAGGNVTLPSLFEKSPILLENRQRQDIFAPGEDKWYILDENGSITSQGPEEKLTKGV